MNDIDNDHVVGILNGLIGQSWLSRAVVLESSWLGQGTRQRSTVSARYSPW
jgi:hypothetical protein